MLELTKENLENVVLIDFRESDRAISFSTSTGGDGSKFINFLSPNLRDDKVPEISGPALMLILDLVTAFTGHKLVKRPESQTGKGYSILIREDTEEGKQIRARIEAAHANL